MLIFGLSGGRNVSKIAEARYRRVVLTFAKVLSSVCGALNPKDMFARVQVLKHKMAMSEYAWFERISFSLTALLIQCELKFYHILPNLRLCRCMVAMIPVKKDSNGPNKSLFCFIIHFSWPYDRSR
jgi:hypothetical protein